MRLNQSNPSGDQTPELMDRRVIKGSGDISTTTAPMTTVVLLLNELWQSCAVQCLRDPWVMRSPVLNLLGSINGFDHPTSISLAGSRRGSSKHPARPFSPRQRLKLRQVGIRDRYNQQR